MLPPSEGHRWYQIILRRMDKAAEWMNPVLLFAAAILVIIDLSLFAASKIR
jgi:hypothetical protein